jgi:phenylpyruvate tautomerase PptA (4-oxalocrotonate tautomerase family)
MPLVRIDLRKGKPAEYVRAVGEAVHRAMAEALDVPERDHFQVIGEHDSNHLVYGANYLEVRRTDDVVFVQVFLSAGRDTAKKQAFYARVARLLEEKPGVRPEDVVIVLVENQREDWSFGRGLASYVVLPREQWK